MLRTGGGGSEKVFRENERIDIICNVHCSAMLIFGYKTFFTDQHYFSVLPSRVDVRETELKKKSAFTLRFRSPVKAETSDRMKK